jgi:hypothetical protein
MPTPQPHCLTPTSLPPDTKANRQFAPTWVLDLSFGLVLALCLCLLSCQNSCNSGQVSQQTYPCGTNAGGGQPCMATVTYASGTPEGVGQFFPNIFGFRTTVAVPSTIKAGDGRIGNSLRLSSGGTNSFIEVGYYSVKISQSIACPTGGGLIYWAAEIDGTGTVIIDCLMQVPQADIGQNIGLEIASTGTDLTKSNSFKVSISAPSGTIDVCGPTFQIRCSTALWSPGSGPFATATVGQTLVGSTGAAASTVAFVHNSYEVSDGVFDFETGESMVSVQNPPFGGVVQAAAPGTQGGTFYTECCLPPSTVFPAQLDFGTTSVGTAAQTQTIVITNIQPSSGNLNLTNIAITGANASEFTQTNNCGNTLAPLANCTVTVTFKPTAQGSRTASLSVTDSGGSGSGTDQATLVGTGG